MNFNLAYLQASINSTIDWVFIIGIQLFLLALFVVMVSFICKMVRKREPVKSVKKTCILVWFLSAIAWFIIAQIVWILIYSQFAGS